jgi:hypothetical protein
MQTDNKTGVIAGIDVHKKMLAVVVARADAPDKPLQEARFGASMGDLEKLREWL